MQDTHIQDLKLDVVEQKTIAEDWKKRYERFLEDLAQMLPPCIVDESAIKGQIQALLAVEEKLRVKESELKKERESHEQEIKRLKEEIDILQEGIRRNQEFTDRLMKRTEKAEKDIQMCMIKTRNTQKNISFIKSMLQFFTQKKGTL